MDSDTKFLEEQNLAEVYRFADFGRLSAGLFHDLATPLNIVLLNLEELQTKCQAIGIEDQKISELQTAINRAFDGTNRMVRFLQLAREHVQRKTVLSKFSIVNEIRQAIALFDQKSYSNNINIYFKTQKDISYFGNATQFFQVVMNLISNAIDSYPYSSQSKKIVISLNEVPRGISITFQDWGEGISKANRSHIFQPLFSTKAEDKGTGIGLYVSREIIKKQFRGRLSFTSAPETGTTFTIHLPRRASLRASK